VGRGTYEINERELRITFLLEVRRYEFEYFDVLQSLNLVLFSILMLSNYANDFVYNP
jgi:hypothetical protein